MSDARQKEMESAEHLILSLIDRLVEANEWARLQKISQEINEKFPAMEAAE